MRIELVTDCKANKNTDLENSELHRLKIHGAILRHIYVRLGIPTALHQPEDHLLTPPEWPIPHCWSVRAELGYTTIQMLDFSGHHFPPTGDAAGCQPLLVLPDP